MIASNSSAAGSKSFGLRELSTVLFRHKKLVLAFSLGAIAVGTLVLLFAPRKYRSETRLFLQVGRESVRLDPTATTGATIGLQQSGRDYEINSAIEVLKSREIVRKAVEKLTPEVVLGRAGDGAAEPNVVADVALAPLRIAVATIKGIDPIGVTEEAVIKVERNLRVEAEYESTVISATYDAETPLLARQVLEAIVEVFREEHLRLHRTDGSKSFFSQQRDALQQQVEEATAVLRDAKNRMGLASIESRRSTLENRLASIQLNRVAVDQSLNAARAEIARLEEQIREMPEWLASSKSVSPNTGADTLRSQLYALQVQLMNLEAKYNADHPLVQSTRNQVEEAAALLAKEDGRRETTVDSANPNRRQLLLTLAQTERTRAGLEARQAEIVKQEAEAMTLLEQLNANEAQLDEHQRRLSIAESNLLRYEQNYEQARIDGELDRQRITNVNIAQHPTIAEKPVSPSKLIVGGLTLMLASFGALAVGLGVEKIDTRIWSVEQLERTFELPVVAVLPEGRAFASIPRRA